MSNETLTVSFDRKSERLLYPPKRWGEPKANGLTMDELIRSNRELEEFAFVASHDLQEPLKIITLYLQLLKRKPKGEFDAKSDTNISYILETSERMQKLIQNILKYARVEKEDIQFKEIDSNVALNKAIENLKITIEDSSAQIRYESCPIIMGDEVRITQLFQNLINNSIKFCKKGTLPIIDISVEQQDDHWLFSIQDNGIGVERDQIDSIFEMFKRLHHKSEYEGSGIGLALCKKIVESHGGNIWAESEIGKGTTFNFIIPII